MAEFCHPEFGCDCAPSILGAGDFSHDELEAILDAVQQVDDEYVFTVGRRKLPGDATVEERRREYTEAVDRGEALIERLRKAVSS